MTLLPGALGGGGNLARGFSALRHRNYRLYWIGQVVSLIGTWMGTVTLPWLVLQLGGSPLQLGIVIALQFTPALFLAPLGGVYADRLDKRKVLIGTQVAFMAQASTLFVLTLTGVIEIWHAMVLSAVAGFINAVDMPVRQAFAVELVPKDDLTNAVALNATSFNLARMVGPAVAGVAIAVIGIAFNFGVNAASYLAVLAGLLMLDPAHIRHPERPEQHPSVISSLAEGLRYAWRTPMVLWPLFLLGGVATFGFNFQVLLPLFARNVLGLEAGGYGALFAAMGVGSLGGSLLLAFAGRRPRLLFMLGGGAAFVVAEVLLGVSRVPLIAYGLVALAGFFSMLMINTINASVQSSVSPALRGRVMALYVTVFAGTVPLGNLFAASVAEAFGSPAGFIAGAGVSALFLALATWQLRAVRARRLAAAAPAGARGTRVGVPAGLDVPPGSARS
ncbi:MAG: MFS transporter [Candidatus Limnocylindria bacterium]